MFVSKKFINTVGLMNDSYFLYYEELDWAIRGQMNGFRFGFAPNSMVSTKRGLYWGLEKIKNEALYLNTMDLVAA